jgi:hypothetical protein
MNYQINQRDWKRKKLPIAANSKKREKERENPTRRQKAPKWDNSTRAPNIIPTTPYRNQQWLHFPLIERTKASRVFLSRNHFQEMSFTLSNNFWTPKDPPTMISSFSEVQINHTTTCHTKAAQNAPDAQHLNQRTTQITARSPEGTQTRNVIPNFGNPDLK